MAAPVLVVPLRAIDVVVESAAFAAGTRTADDELGDERDVAQLEQIAA